MAAPVRVGQLSLADLAADPEFLFRQVPPLRALARQVAASAVFNGVSLVAVLASVIGMTVGDASALRSGTPSAANDAIDRLDLLTLMVFTIEFVVKVLASGLLPLPQWCPAILKPDRVWRPAVLGSREPLGGTATLKPLPSAAVMPLSSSAHSVNSSSDVSLNRAESSTSTSNLTRDRGPTGDGLSRYIRGVMQAKHAAVLATSLPHEREDYYFRSNWNRLDFAMLLIGYLGLVAPSSGGGLGGLRALRALRPLRAFRFFAPLQSILHALWASASALANVLVCLAFFFLLLSLMGQQFFQGVLQRRCVVPSGADALRFDTASPGFARVWEQVRQSPNAAPSEFVVYQPETWCSFESDPRSFLCSDLAGPQTVAVASADGSGTNVTVPLVCAKVGANPRLGLVNFDDLGGSLYVVFMISSMEVQLEVSPFFW